MSCPHSKFGQTRAAAIHRGWFGWVGMTIMRMSVHTNVALTGKQQQTRLKQKKNYQTICFPFCFEEYPLHYVTTYRGDLLNNFGHCSKK